MLLLLCYHSLNSSTEGTFKKNLSSEMTGARLFTSDENSKENCCSLSQYGLPSLVAKSLLSKLVLPWQCLYVPGLNGNCFRSVFLICMSVVHLCLSADLYIALTFNLCKTEFSNLVCIFHGQTILDGISIDNCVTLTQWTEMTCPGVMI